MNHASELETEVEQLKSADNGRLARLTRAYDSGQRLIMAVSMLALLAAALVLTCACSCAIS